MFPTVYESFDAISLYFLSISSYPTHLEVIKISF